MLLASSSLWALPSPDDRWIRADSAHFTIFSDAPIHTVRALSKNLELLQSVLGSLNPGRTINSPLPTYVFIFRNEASFRSYNLKIGGKPAAISGYFLSHPHANYIVVDGSAGPNPSAVIFHEYLHYFARHNLPRVPLWFNEGLAEFYSTLELSENEALIGKPVAHHVDWLRNNDLQPFRSFLATDTRSGPYNEAQRQGGFYAQSWALVHMLLAGDQDRRSRVARYLRLLDENDLVPGDNADADAFAMAFDATPRSLQRELSRYVDRPRFEHFRQRLETVDMEPVFQPTEIRYTEILCRLGDLLVHLNPARLIEASQHFDAALKLDPRFPLARTSKGYVKYLRNDYDAAALHYEESIEESRDDFLVFFLAGINQMKLLSMESEISYSDPHARAARIQAARAYFRQSIRLRKDFAEAYAGLGSTYVADESPSSDGVEALTIARESLPHRADVTFNLAILTARLGRRNEAEVLIEQILIHQADPATVDRARESLLRADLLAADQYLHEGDLESGLAILDFVLGRTSDSVLFGELSETADQIRRMQAQREDRLVFDEAMDLIRESRYDEALERLESLAERTDDSELRAAAEDNIRRLRPLG